MKTLLRQHLTILMLSLSLLLAACAPLSPKIQSNSSPNLDITQYKTFGFFDELDTDHRYESILSQSLKQSTKEQMMLRGFTYSNSSPDLLINFRSEVENKQEVRQVASPNIGYYGYFGRIYVDTWTRFEPMIDNFNEGTLIIDVVDSDKKQMVWEGIAVSRVNDKKMTNLPAHIPKLVADIFTQFPVADPILMPETNK
jgi:hypothetical protein